MTERIEQLIRQLRELAAQDSDRVVFERAGYQPVFYIKAPPTEGPTDGKER